MDITELQKLWRHVPPPWTFLPPRQGISNLTQLIDTPTGKYVLRRYNSERAVKHIRYEIAVLVELDKLSLPFRVPVPLPTVTGERLAVFDEGVVITLSPWLSGVHPSQGSAYEAGVGLVQLVKALGQVHIETNDEIVPMPTCGDFEAWATEPLEIIHRLSIDTASKTAILRLVEAMAESIPLLYQTLPQQITHRDYDASNILVENARVVGVLDFEFSAPDLQVVDFAFALSQWWSDWGEIEGLHEAIRRISR